MPPTVSADLEIMRASVLLDADPTAAARCAGDILARWPGNEAAELLLAAACLRIGEPEAALRALGPLARGHPDSPIMQLELGRVHAACGQGAAALAALQRAVTLDAALADGWRELAAQWFLAGDVPAGDAAYLAYSRLAPDSPELNDAHLALAESRLDAAAAVVARRLLAAPHDVAALRLAGDVAVRRGDHRGAEKLYRDCLDAAPGYAAARYGLARVLYAEQRIEALLPHIERLLAADPGHSGYSRLKAQAMRLIGRNADSIELIERVLARDPDDVDSWLLFGNLLRETGEQARAIDSYRRAIALQPDFGEAYWALANLKTFRFSVTELEAMRGQVARGPMLGPNRARLEFALGKALEDEGAFAESFEHYAVGNALHRGTLDYDPDTTTAFVQRSAAAFTRRFFDARGGWGSDRLDPIFIVGLPRSGSTLLEQILASHSNIEGTRELPDLPAIVMELVARRAPGAAVEYPESVHGLGRADIEALAARYLTQTQAHRPLGRPRFVDKMLGNFSNIGMICLMFPRATIIDVRRHPLGGGFACYKQLFARGMNFSYDLRELGRYYRDYVDLMEHIDAVLPGRVHRIYYEQLVADPETEVRRMLDHCRLPFEDGCLRFHANRRVVQTVSSEQVRRPIYADAVEQWRNYAPWLGPLKAALGDLVERYP